MKNMFDDLESELKIHLKGFVKGQAGNLFDSLGGEGEANNYGQRR